MSGPHRNTSSTRFPVAVDDALRAAGWQPGRWDMHQAEQWADTLRGHITPAGHRHTVLASAVEVWAEFGNLPIAPTGPGRHIAPTRLRIDPLHALHAARTLADLGRALGTGICPLGTDGTDAALLAIDTDGRVYSLDHTGDWYLGRDFDAALGTLLTGTRPERLTRPAPPGTTGTADTAGPAGASGLLPGPAAPRE
ncbi:SUKH-3 domain-containing protein [Streptomyces albidus (ex Kaewkla and Franco 2022)]|uniref:SUKH-3 domain-containing protein n=1 Tax=Streptomyces albidus (ex Kaewkla and Franco 2022) TaxID=722709 RepID=UPI0015EEA994|nr:SUKH-3 domain-containing protein [Streptomyces albidus (ex Kaewkla and Franco 2022)]